MWNSGGDTALGKVFMKKPEWSWPLGDRKVLERCKNMHIPDEEVIETVVQRKESTSDRRFHHSIM